MISTISSLLLFFVVPQIIYSFRYGMSRISSPNSLLSVNKINLFNKIKQHVVIKMATENIISPFDSSSTKVIVRQLNTHTCYISQTILFMKANVSLCTHIGTRRWRRIAFNSWKCWNCSGRDASISESWRVC